jgi:hypothetical protein
VGTVVDGCGSVLGLLGAGFDRSPGRWESRRSRAAAAATASRGALGSGEVEAGDNGWGGSVACVGARGGEGQFNLAGGRLELGARLPLMAPAVARSDCWASRTPRQGRQRLYRRSANLLTTGGRTGAPRGRRRPSDRSATRETVRRRGVLDILGTRAGMEKGRPWRAGPRAACTRGHRVEGRGREAALARGGAASRLGAHAGAPVVPGEFSCVGLALFDRIFLKIFE